MSRINCRNEKQKEMRKNASCENNLRFCAEKRENFYSWLPYGAEDIILLLTSDNIMEKLSTNDQDQQYDYIILDDVLWSAGDICNGEGVEGLIKTCKSRLRSGGKLIVNTANRIGAQYLAGRPDDHEDRYFNGIDSKENGLQDRFTREELKTLLQDCGFFHTLFFYPYPNQQYIKEIFSDDSIEKYQYGKSYYNTVEGKIHLFDETKFIQTLVKEGAARYLANAFMVVASEEEAEKVKDILYVKLNYDRDERFRIGTVLDKGGKVKKYALSQEAEKHIQNLYECQEMPIAKDCFTLKGEYAPGEIIYPLLNCDNLDTLLLKEVGKKHREAFLALFDGFYKRLFDNAEYTATYNGLGFKEVFGDKTGKKAYHCISPANIDLICDNIFCQDGQYQVIDCEWVFPFAVPVELIIWRTINEFYSKHPQVQEFLPRKELYDLYGIDEEDEKLFLRWSYHFAYEYVKSDGIRKYVCEEVSLDLRDICIQYTRLDDKEYMDATIVQPEFLCDRGNGFEKNDVLIGEMETDKNCFTITVALPKRHSCKMVKWMPIPGRTYYMQIHSLKGGRIVGQNAYQVREGKYSFLFGDAFFYLQPEKDADQIIIEGELFYLKIREQRAVVEEAQQEIEALTEKIRELEAEKAGLQADLDSVLNSTIWRKSEPIRRYKDERTAKKEEKKRRLEADENKPEQEEVRQEKEIKDSFWSCIDSCNLEEGMMSIDGWLFCENHKIDAVYLILEDVFGNRHSYPFSLSGRKDVAEALEMRFRGECGVSFNAAYKSFCPQKIIFRAQVDGEWYEIDTKSYVPATEDTDAGEFYLEKFMDNDMLPDYGDFVGKHMKSLDYHIEDWKVDVIVPVYNGMQYLPGLFESMERTEVNYRLILIEDCSPDEKVRPYLKEYAASKDNVVLLENETNLGFVKSVNKALRMAKHHVALVNTDVVLPKNWLERLMHPIFTDRDVASVTPFTNSGTIFSFPDFAKDNSLFLGLGVDEIDAVFARLLPDHVKTPTGVGFCMGMNKQVMDEIGILDEETFEKGYGEENDWCQRAIDAGYKNVYAENLFVHHNHGGSFPSETKKRLLEENAKKLLQKHPDYNRDVAKFCKEDPNREIREFVKFELMFFYDAPFVLAFDHDLGGGASDYLAQKRQLLLQEGKTVGIVRYNMVLEQYCVRVYCKDQEGAVLFKTREELMNLLKKRQYQQIWINELATYIELEQHLSDIIKLRKENAESLRLLIHDYFVVCSSLNLLDGTCKYCRVPEDMEICDQCLVKNEFTYSTEEISQQSWRNIWRTFMENCDEIIAFCEDSVQIISKVYPEVEKKLQLIPHQIAPLEKIKRERKTTKTCNIGVMGAISRQKGLHVLLDMARIIEEKDIDMHITIIGESEEEIESPVVTVTGRYVREDIAYLTRKHDIDIFFIPSIWPETFSYTTAEIMSMDMPIAVFDLGAPPERVKGYKKGLVLPGPEMDREELVDALYRFAKEQA